MCYRSIRSLYGIAVAVICKFIRSLLALVADYEYDSTSIPDKEFVEEILSFIIFNYKDLFEHVCG